MDNGERFYTASGEPLDLIGEYNGIVRAPGVSDADFRLEIIHAMSAGFNVSTPAGVTTLVDHNECHFVGERITGLAQFRPKPFYTIYPARTTKQETARIFRKLIAQGCVHR